jgi:hypothetical protein
MALHWLPEITAWIHPSHEGCHAYFLLLLLHYFRQLDGYDFHQMGWHD